MSSSRRSAVGRLAPVVWACLAACSDGVSNPEPPADVTGVSIAPTSVTLTPGQTRQLAATVRDDDGSALANVTVFWSSEHPEIATVSADGLIRAVKAGTSRVAASVGGKSATATVRVIPPGAATVSVSPGSVTLDIGRTASLSATAKDAAGATLSGRTVAWRSSAASVATVSSSGTVTAVGAGTATITATVDGKNGSSTITVRRPAVDRVVVAPALTILERGATVTLRATPYDARGNALSGRTVTWTTSDDRVATVNAQGVVTAKRGGSATITATIEGKRASAGVTVRGGKRD